MKKILRYLFPPKVKLSDFAKQVEAIANENNKQFYRVKIELQHHYGYSTEGSNKKSLIFEGYISGFNIHTGSTIKEVIEKIKHEINPSQKILQEVEI